MTEKQNRRWDREAAGSRGRRRGKPRAPAEVRQRQQGPRKPERPERDGPPPAKGGGPGPERIQKVLARSGWGSRRACEELIREGRVTVDGEVVSELGAKADLLTQDVRVDGIRVRAERPAYYLLNKPKHVLCSREDPSGRKTVFECLPQERRRLVAVGRLDADSRGAIILTNDGAFTNLLTHPRYGIAKTYEVRVRGSVEEGALRRLREGIWLSEGRTLPAEVWVLKRSRDQTELGIRICEGKNRQVRRMFAKVGHKVLSLTRTRIGGLTLKGLAEGEARPLTSREVDELRTQARQNAQAAPPPARTRGRRSRLRSQGKPDPAGGRRPAYAADGGDEEP